MELEQEPSQPSTPPSEIYSHSRRNSIVSETTLGIGRYDSVKSIISIDAPDDALLPASLNLPSSSNSEATTLTPIHELDDQAQHQFQYQHGYGYHHYEQPTTTHPRNSLLPPLLSIRRISAEAPQVVEPWMENHYMPYAQPYPRSDLPLGPNTYTNAFAANGTSIPYAPSFQRKEGTDTPVGQSFSKNDGRSVQYKYRYPVKENPLGAHPLKHEDDLYDDHSPSAKEIPFPRQNVSMPSIGSQNGEKEKENRNKMFGALFVILVAFAAFVIGGGIGGGISVYITGKAKSPVVEEVCPNVTNKDSPTSCPTQTNTQLPSNVTSAITCLCCENFLSPTSSPSTYISALSPSLLFHLNCSSDLGPPATPVESQKAQPSANSMDLTSGNVTTSLGLCIDMCAAWNTNHEVVSSSGACSGVSWMVQTDSVTRGNLMCVLKKGGVVWTGWAGGSRGISALLA